MPQALALRSQELLAVYRGNVFHGLEFNHDLSFHQQ
jgi:hypothetical protein